MRRKQSAACKNTPSFTSSLMRKKHSNLFIFSALYGFGLVASQQLWTPPFKRLPIGAVKPAGWALDQAHIQADGLAGQQADWYPYVVGSIWTGGTMEYSDMHEASPYWFNAQIALAFQLQDKRLIGKVRAWLDYVLDHQGEDGWLGPEPFVANATIPRLVWPRYLALLGLIQYAEADPTQTTRIVDAIHRFTDYAYYVWTHDLYGDPSLGFQFDYQYHRWEELIYGLQWVYDNYPRGKEAQLIETMKLVKASGFDWKNDWFQPDKFPQGVVTNYIGPTHGVNIGEALKSEALVYRWTQDASDKQNTVDRIELLYKYHGLLGTGTYTADEHLAGLSPQRGTELCAVVEQMFSLAIIYQTFGNNSVADRAERLAYNALPGQMTADWWGHQYDQQVNQVWAKNMSEDAKPWGYNSGYSNVFGMEPNYPCCTVNHPQGYPKFWAYSFFSDSAGTSLTHALLGPASVATVLTGNNRVNVAVRTLYPFGTVLSYTITATRTFTFRIRVPEYAKGSTSSTISINGRAAALLTPSSTTSLHSVTIPAGTTTLRVNLNMPLQVNTLARNGAVVINRGPLNYVVRLDHNVTETLAWRNPQAASDAQRLFPNAPKEYFTTFDSHAHDWTLLPTSEWRLAINPSTISIIDKSASLSSLPYHVWEDGAQPVTMTAKACQIEWGESNGTAADPPKSPALCVGSVFNVTLVPYAGTKLRIGEIPTMSSI